MTTIDDVDAWRPDELYDRLRAADVALPTLTDEELAAVSPAGEPGPVPLPRVAGLPPATRDVAVATALRGLAARRWIRLARPGEPGRVVATGSLGLLLGLRQHPAAVAVVERVRPEGSDARHLHVGRDAWTVLEEQRHDGGQHTFLLRCLPRVAHAIAAAVDPHGWGTVEGPPLVCEQGRPPPGWERVDRVVATAAVVTRITTLVALEEGPRRSHVSFLASRAGGVWVVGGSERRVTAAPVPTAGLADVVAACLTPGAD